MGQGPQFTGLAGGDCRCAVDSLRSTVAGNGLRITAVMIKINLLPEELRESQRVRRVKINIAAIAVAALSIAILCVVIASTIVGQHMRDAARVRGQLEKLKPQAQA